MPVIPEELLLGAAMVRRQLREVKGLKEARPGVFQVGTVTLISFKEEDGTLVAELANAGSGQPARRFALANTVETRALVDEARRRVTRLMDE